MGAQGAVGIVAGWTAYREFTFAEGQAIILPADMSSISEMAAYMAQNPSLQLGIDSTGDTRNANLNARRMDAVRVALGQAGVRSTQIQTGAFGHPQQTQDRQVAVLISTQ
jgi:outer membrane protein OmpA-like peptidoglycan-associated protein